MLLHLLEVIIHTEVFCSLIFIRKFKLKIICYIKVKVKVTLRLTVSQSVSKSWYRAPSGAHDQIFITVWQLRASFLWGALSDERTGLSFVYAAGPCQRSLSRVRVPSDSWLYFTVSDLRLPFSSPPTTRRVTVEVFDPASTRGICYIFSFLIRRVVSFLFFTNYFYAWLGTGQLNIQI
jgi:hypothetical protein